MPYCSNCGKEVATGAKFCPECGAPLGQAPGPVAVQAPVRPHVPKPPVTTPLTWFALVVGVVFLFFGAVLILYTPTAPLVFTFVLLFAVGVLSLASAYGLYRRRRWLFNVGRVNAIVALVIGVLFAVTGTGLPLLLGVLGILLGAALLYCLGRPDVKKYLAS